MMTDLTWSTVVLKYVCPTLGCIMATIMFAAPVNDLRKAMERGSLDSLNPFPWVAMTGNCLGWCAYAYYTGDPFVLASNLPGFVLSLWLNSGAAKLQFLEKWQQPGTTKEELIVVPQERNLLVCMILWSIVLVYVGWLGPNLLFGIAPSLLVGVVVNINLVFFYAAPLESIQRVLSTRTSDSIHLPTQIMTCTNTTFWSLYALAIQDPIILIPNVMGLVLGILQGILRWIYPQSTTTPDNDNSSGAADTLPINEIEDDHSHNLLT